MQNSSDTITAIGEIPAPAARAALPLTVIGGLAFLTVVDLFAAQAILPSLTEHYNVLPSQMAVAVNASTIGMAVSSLLVALFNKSIPRRAGIVCALLILAFPTARLAHAASLGEFTALRIMQGLLMAGAFSLTLAYLGERTPAQATATAFAAYIAGNVASNLIGRFAAATATDHLGLSAAFYILASLNLAGAALAYVSLTHMKPECSEAHSPPSWLRLKTHLSDRSLLSAFLIGFLILFAFIGTFSFINFTLVRPPLSVSMSGLGFSYAVFAPSIATTLAAGAAVKRWGSRRALWIGFAVAGAGLPLLLAGNLATVLAGMTLVAAGTFFAQGTATGFVSRTAKTDRAAASGLYLTSYFFGGIVGAAVLGRVFDAFGWPGCVAGIAVALALAFLLTLALSEPSGSTQNS